jgi:hypothetical protein
MRRLMLSHVSTSVTHTLQVWFPGEHSDVGGGWEAKATSKPIKVEFSSGRNPRENGLQDLQWAVR